MKIFEKSSFDIIKKCHLRLKYAIKKKKNNIYTCDFILRNLRLWEISFTLNLNISCLSRK